jgi:putative sigma-54 modulation protein
MTTREIMEALYSEYAPDDPALAEKYAQDRTKQAEEAFLTREELAIMRINVKAKNTQVTEPLTDYINKRFSKLEKYFVDADLAGTVTLIVEKGIHRVEATIPLNRYILRAEENSNDMYASIDGVVDKLERQIRKYKTKVNRKGKVQTFAEVVADAEPAPAVEDEKVIKTKTFALKPMDEEEAIMQMELLEHDFFVFLDAESNGVNVVYKRKDGQYGLIVPTID